MLGTGVVAIGIILSICLLANYVVLLSMLFYIAAFTASWGTGLLGIAGRNLHQRNSRQSARHCCRHAVVGELLCLLNLLNDG